MPNRPLLAQDLRVLVVEDDATLAATLCAVLSPPFATEWVQTAMEGLQRIFSLELPPISCTVLDLKLPNGQGSELVKRFQSSFPRVPIVVLTGLDEEQVGSEEIIHMGAQEVLRKPVERKDLLDAVVHSVARHRVRQAFAPMDLQLEQMRKGADARESRLNKAEEVISGGSQSGSNQKRADAAAMGNGPGR